MGTPVRCLEDCWHRVGRSERFVDTGPFLGPLRSYGDRYPQIPSESSVYICTCLLGYRAALRLLVLQGYLRGTNPAAGSRWIVVQIHGLTWLCASSTPLSSAR